jgi:hypothetical protein
LQGGAVDINALKKIVEDTINKTQEALTKLELLHYLPKEIYTLNKTSNEVFWALDELINEKKVLAIKYSLPNSKTELLLILPIGSKAYMNISEEEQVS